MINQSNKVLNTDITKLVNQDYQYGFSTNIEKDIEKGLNENTIRLISQKKKKQVFIRTDLKLLQK
jgi:hydroxylamine reductase (hybrid-cluster protein)